MSAEIAAHDPDSLFLRYGFDARRNLLISSYDPQSIGLDQWIKQQGAGTPASAIERISSQLKEALGVLKAAGLVHSDINPQNILINPRTLQIKLIDFGCTAVEGEYAPGRKDLLLNRRGGRLKSAGQNSDLPATHADDEFAVEKTIEALREKIRPGSVAQTAPPQPHQITALPSTSPEWTRLVTRDGSITDPGFPGRLHDSMSMVFEPYVDRFLAGDEGNFEKMLRDQHRIVSAGSDGRNRYWGSSMGLWNYVMLNPAVPGQTRNEVFAGPEIFKWRLWVSVKEKLGGQAPSNRRGASEPVQIEGIPSKWLPTREVGSDKVYYIYPPRKAVPIYLQAMGDRLKSALRLLREGGAPEEIVPLLADYIQLGVSGHIFNLANFSIYMTEVNGILRRLGYRGVSPANLDYHALVEDSDTFRQRFLSEVARAGTLQ